MKCPDKDMKCQWKTNSLGNGKCFCPEDTPAPVERCEDIVSEKACFHSWCPDKEMKCKWANRKCFCPENTPAPVERCEEIHDKKQCVNMKCPDKDMKCQWKTNSIGDGKCFCPEDTFMIKSSVST
eukprot:TRINITY_DN166_c0_g1_i1.p2 TRINITY_DN166_c0_g1~~TRINITY_DN166_c0_g1_i1.p2  ORF type:complete len:125 (+),score=26.38 TRINITY_DN166_c0_g1_i1:725-1099(+)